MSQKRTNMIVCGHIDHGKSTFVGRLLTELGLIPKDRLDYLRSSTGPSQKLEYAQLVDALADEKSKGITIGLSQLAFKYQEQNYAFYDAPGHFEFMQNMITGAARADAAFLLIDAFEGLKESTLRHLYALSFIGVKDVIVLINKMDLVDYSEQRFLELSKITKTKMQELGMDFQVSIPIVAYTAENFCVASPRMTWYSGPQVITVMTQLNQRTDILLDSNKPTRFLVQDVFEYKNRKIVFSERIQGKIKDSKDYTVFCNSAVGTIRLGAKKNMPTPQDSFPLYQGDQQKSFDLESSTIPITRGALIYENQDSKILFSDELKCAVFWFGSSSLEVGEEIILKIAKQEIKASVVAIENIFDCNNLTYQHHDQILQKGRVAICHFKTTQSIFFDYFINDSKLGRLVLVKNNIITAAGKVRS